MRRPPSSSSKARSYPARSTGSSYSTSASPAAALAAASSRVAASTPPVAPSDLSAPSTVAAQPRLALTSRSALRSAPRSAGASESRKATRSPGRDRLTTLSRQPPGRTQSSLSCSVGSAESVGASPHSRIYSATTSPPAPTTVTSKAPIATATSRDALAGPAE